MAEDWNGRERRKHPRIPLKGEVKGKIHTVSSAPVIDLSVEGALLEVPCALKPKSLYTMRLAISPTEHLEIKGKVIRSYVHGFERNERGETVVKYRAAVQFQAISDSHKETLYRVVQRLSQNAMSANLERDKVV
ncbi:MAG TPA: PilZ domain-containing protein [Vicinamibacteria bacterium]|nr:PilZ domain-containing protein [Vicinamibacteria bacterium]